MFYGNRVFENAKFLEGDFTFFILKQTVYFKSSFTAKSQTYIKSKSMSETHTEKTTAEQ